MDLKKAIDLEELVRLQGHLGLHSSAEARIAGDVVLAAAKRDLARQEAEKPRRHGLVILETVARNKSRSLGENGNRDDSATYGSIADILKALREEVVPKLKGYAGDGEQTITIDQEQFFELLRALGEVV